MYGLELEPGPGGGAEGRPRGRRRAGEGRRASRGDINKPSARAVRARSARPAHRVAGSEPRSPLPRCALPPAHPPSSWAAVHAGYRMARRVGRPGSPCSRGAASRLVLCSRRRPRRLPARPLPAALPPSVAVALPLSASSAGSPPRPPLLSAFLLPSLRPPAAQASARRSPPVAALAPAPALRSRPGDITGGPGAPRRGRRAVLAPPAGGAGSGPRRAPATSLRVRHPAGAELPAARCPSGRPLASASPPRGAPLPGAASALGPCIQHWPQGQRPLLSRAGVKCLPPPPAEPSAAFALQFSRPPQEPTALCAPQHWSWGQQRLPSRVATLSQEPRWPDGCTRPRSESLAPRGHLRVSSTVVGWAA